MNRFLPIVLALFLVLAAQAVTAAPKPPRPTAGIGVLLVRPFPEFSTLEATVIKLFHEPGVGREVEVAAGSVHLLAPILGRSAVEAQLAVTERREGWMRVVYDDAGREGWVGLERSWSFVEWEYYLKGKSAQLLPGLRKPYYQLLREPYEFAAAEKTLTATDIFRVIGLEGDWALVLAGVEKVGWLRWRDRDGRFTVAVGDGVRKKR